MIAKSTGKGKPPKAPRPPHNATKSKAFGSAGELACAIGAEPRRATLRGKEVVMSQAERLCRVTVESAINGSVSDLRLLIRTMIDNPEVGRSAKEQWVLFVAGEDAEL